MLLVLLDGDRSGEALQAACRRGDLLAALCQASYGDLSFVTAAELQAAEAAWRGRAADLDESQPPAWTGSTEDEQSHGLFLRSSKPSAWDP